MPFGSLRKRCSWNRDSALAFAAATSSQLHFSYHSCVHRWERRERKKKSKVWNRFFTGSLKVWCFVADAVFAAPGKVNPERRISLTKAACLRGWGIILQRVTWIDLEGEGSVARKGSKYAAGGRGQWRQRWTWWDGWSSPQGWVLGTMMDAWDRAHVIIHTRGRSDPG